MSGETSAPQSAAAQPQFETRSAFGIVGEAAKRHDESVVIDTMSVGEPGSPESAQSQPIVRVSIFQDLPGDREALRMGEVSARPIYIDADYDGPNAERVLEETLRGYQVRVELRHNEERDSWPPFGIDYAELGYDETSTDNIYDFTAFTQPVPFDDALELVRTTMSVLRDHREG